MQRERTLSEALHLVLTCDLHTLLAVASPDTLVQVKKRLSALAQGLDLKLAEGPQVVVDEKAIKEDLLPATLWTHIFFTFLDPYAHQAIFRTCLEFRQLLCKNEMMLLNNFMSRTFSPFGGAPVMRLPSGNRSPNSSPPNSPPLSPRPSDVSPPPLQRVVSPQMFSLSNPPDLESLKALTACVRLRPSVLRPPMLPYHYIEAVINFTNMALRQITSHHEGDDDELLSAADMALIPVLLVSFELLLALLWRPRLAETHQDLYVKIFTHMLSHMTTLHDLFEPGWQLMLASFSSHDKYDRNLVSTLLRPYLNPFRHYSTFSLVAVSDLRCLLQLLPKMFSPTLADKLFEHLVRLHGLLGGAISQGAQPDSRVEEIVPLIQGVIGLFPLISGGQRLKPQIDQVAASLAFYQQQSKSGPDKKRKDSKTKKMMERKKSILASQGTRTYPSAAKTPRGASNVMEPRPKLDRVRSGGREDEALAGRPGILRLGSHETRSSSEKPSIARMESMDDVRAELSRMKSLEGKKAPITGRAGSGDGDKVLSESESDDPVCRRCRGERQDGPSKSKPPPKDSPETTAKSAPKFGALSINPAVDLEGANSEIPMFLRVRSRSFGPAERRRISRDRKEAMGLNNDAADDDVDEEEDVQQELKQKLIQQELHRQLQQQLQSQQFEQLQRQQMQFLQQMQAQQVQALANMQRQQNMFLQSQFEQKHGPDGLSASGSTNGTFLTPGSLPISQPPSPGGNTHSYLPSDRPSPPSRPQSPPGVPPSLSCSAASQLPSWPQPFAPAPPPSAASTSFASSSSCAPSSSFASSSSSFASSSSPPFASSSSSSASSLGVARRPPPPPSGTVIPPLARGGSGNVANGNTHVVCHVCTKSTSALSAACFHCGTHLTMHVAAPGGWRSSLESQFSATFPQYSSSSDMVQTPAQRAMLMQQGQDRSPRPRD